MKSARSVERERRLKKVIAAATGLYWAGVFVVLMIGSMIAFLALGRLFFPTADLNDWPAIALFIAILFMLVVPAVFLGVVVWLRVFISKRGPLRAMRWIVERKLEHEPPSVWKRCVLKAAGVDWRGVLKNADEYHLFKD